MAWLALLLASVFEIAWAVGLKDQSRWPGYVPVALTVLNMAMSALLLGYAVRTLPLGMAYAVWTGLGILGTVLAGILWFGEPMSYVRLGCIALISVGILGLRLS
jgi:quaternary ammonium compound-resistance protein SugE